ncbi:MAG: DUF362 domain-containing protein [Candidatus Sumerlaeaceae bacterium]
MKTAGEKHGADKTDASRRRFLRRLAETAVLAVGAGAVYRLFHDPHGPQSLSRHTLEVEGLRGWNIRDVPPAMAVVRGEKRRLALEAAFDALGGLSKFIQRGDRVLLKVNAAFATPPELGATTHPELVEALVALCLKAGAAEVIVADNPINNADSCFRITGIGAAAERAGASILLPRTRAFRPFSLPDGQLVRRWPLFAEPLERATKVVGVAPVKHHNRSGASMTMKNWYGLLGGRRNVFHQDINTIVAELARMMRPTLVVLDGTYVMVRNGPTGGSLSDLERRDTLIVSTDQLAADAYGAVLLGKSPDDLPYLRMAEQAGVGTTSYRALSFHEIGSQPS